MCRAGPGNVQNWLPMHNALDLCPEMQDWHWNVLDLASHQLRIAECQLPLWKNPTKHPAQNHAQKNSFAAALFQRWTFMATLGLPPKTTFASQPCPLHFLPALLSPWPRLRCCLGDQQRQVYPKNIYQHFIAKMCPMWITFGVEGWVLGMTPCIHRWVYTLCCCLHAVLRHWFFTFPRHPCA